MSDLVLQDAKEVVNSLAVATHASSTRAVNNPALESRVWHKLDYYVLPVVAMIYLLSFLDRTNIGNVRVSGFQEDLNITNTQYSMALTVTSIPYIAAELPSNLLLRAVGPNRMLPVMLTLWGIVTTLHGFVESYYGLLTTLMVTVGGIVPGLVLYLSLFYPRHKMNIRMTAFFSLASLSGAFSGILAFGIIKIKQSPTQARPGWAWVFIIEGIFTVLFGFASFALLPRSPKTAYFLTPEEREYVVCVLREDASIDDELFRWSEVGKAFMAPQVVMLGIIFFFTGAILLGFSLFAPSIIEGLGFTPSTAQLMSVPPFIVAFTVAIVFAFISDRYKCRGLITVISSLLCTIGFAMFLGSGRHAVQYCSLFFSITGAYSLVPVISTWSSNNTAPHTRRATAIAIGFICSNLGGVLSTWLLGSLSTAPRYHSATIVLLIFSVGITLFAAANVAYLVRQNRLKAEVRRTLPREEEKKGMGDRSAWFEYIL
ncbi:MFS transporter superfamily protein [Pleurotus pulmonarius]